MRLLSGGRTLCNPKSPDRSQYTERELGAGSMHAGSHALGFTVLRWRFPREFLEDAIEVDVDALSDGEDVVIGGIMQHIEEAGIHSGDSSCVLPAVDIPE